MCRLLDEIRDAIDASGESRYRIAKETGVAESVLSRLMSGEQRLSIPSLEKLADYLGYEVVMRRSKGRRPNK